MRGIIIFSIVFLICGSLGDPIEDYLNFIYQNAVPKYLNELAKNLYHEIAKNKEGNFVFAPISVAIALSMLASGSLGDTKNQLIDVLFPGDRERDVHEAIPPLLEKFKNFSGVDLKLANKIFLSDLATLSPQFNDNAPLSFGATAQSVDFSDSDNAQNLINQWCEEQTDSKIKNVIAPGDIGVDTVIVLLNAVYFKGNWANKFLESETKDSEFYLGNGEIKYVPTMSRLGRYPVGYLEDLKAKFVQLPYENADKNDGLSMFIIVPDDLSGLKYIEENILNIDLYTLSHARTMKIHLYLPKFKIESSFDLKSPLEKLGVTEIFTPAADFRGLSTSPNLVVSKFSQKAFIEVNEEGSEAAAITSITISNRFGGAPEDFRVNQPFILLIATKNSIIFMARIVDP